MIWKTNMKREKKIQSKWNTKSIRSNHSPKMQYLETLKPPATTEQRKIRNENKKYQETTKETKETKETKKRVYKYCASVTESFGSLLCSTNDCELSSAFTVEITWKFC